MWLHGDLHPANILTVEGRVSAVIDFGDITSGDPACDLAIIWMLLPPAERALFWQTYASRASHPVDADLQARTRGWALMFTTVFLARSADNPVMLQIGHRTAHALATETEHPTGTTG